MSAFDDLFEEDIERALGAIQESGTYQYYEPLTKAVEEFIHFAQHPEERVFIGIPEIDEQIRGVAPAEFVVIQGFAHNGKTVLATELIIANEDVETVVFSPDETRMALLVKITSATTGIGAVDLERRINAHDPDAIRMLSEVAERFKKLVVFDDNVSILDMTRRLAEATSALGCKPRVVIFDYMSQLREDVDDRAKLDLLKAWGKDHRVVFIGLHQVSRSKGSGGKEVTIDSGAYGGEQQATFMIGVRRKINYYLDRIRDLETKLQVTTSPSQIQRYMDEIDDIRHYQIPAHKNTISVSLLKNKRPPMTLVDELDFRLDTETGRIVKIEKHEPDDLFIPTGDTIRVGGSAMGLLGAT